QDLAAATFLNLCAEQKGIDPAQAKKAACQRWFGDPEGKLAPNPPDPNDRLTICALAQMDQCFDKVKTAPMYTFEQAKVRCQQKGGPNFSPCFGCAPLSATPS